MGRRIVLASLVAAVVLGTVSACGSAPGHQSNKRQSEANTAGIVSSGNRVSDPLPGNVITTPVPNASSTVTQFYVYINEKQYDKAFRLFGPDLQVDASLANRKFFYNMKHVTLSGLTDVSSHPGHLFNLDWSRFYSVKFFYALLDFQQYNESLNPDLTGLQSMRFTLVQMHKGGPWLIDEATNVPPM